MLLRSATFYSPGDEYPASRHREHEGEQEAEHRARIKTLTEHRKHEDQQQRAADLHPEIPFAEGPRAMQKHFAADGQRPGDEDDAADERPEAIGVPNALLRAVPLLAGRSGPFQRTPRASLALPG